MSGSCFHMSHGLDLALKEGLSGEMSLGSMASASNSINTERAGVSADTGM